MSQPESDRTVEQDRYIVFTVEFKVDTELRGSSFVEDFAWEHAEAAIGESENIDPYVADMFMAAILDGYGNGSADQRVITSVRSE